MTIAYLVRPDFTVQNVTFADDAAAADLLGQADGLSEVRLARVSCVFTRPSHPPLVLLYNESAAAAGAEPNPTASLGRDAQVLQDPSFLDNPTSALHGSAIFVGSEGADLSEVEREDVDNGIHAARNYLQDHPDEAALWHNAAINLNRN